MGKTRTLLVEQRDCFRRQSSFKIACSDEGTVYHCSQLLVYKYLNKTPHHTPFQVPQQDTTPHTRPGTPTRHHTTHPSRYPNKTPHHVLHVVINLLGFPVLPQQTTQYSLSPHPDYLLWHSSVRCSFSLPVPAVTTFLLSSQCPQDSGPGVDHLRLPYDQTVLDQLTNVLSYMIQHVYMMENPTPHVSHTWYCL